VPVQSPWDISVEDLKRLREEGADFVLIDVREPHEVEICEIGGQLIPLGTLAGRISELDSKAHTVVYCRSGGRSANAVKAMRGAGFENVWNVNGGILAWIERIDPSLTPY
jgi:sulfur-carrier protein adenylyltransferase/sulfurtransferase